MSETVYVTRAQLNKLLKGATVTIKDDGNEEIELEFSNGETLKRFRRNQRAGKGTRVSLDDFMEITDAHTGGSLFSKRNMRKIRGGFENLGNKIKNNSFIRDVGKASIVAGTTTGGMFLGGPMGAIVGGVAGQRLADKSGLGLRQRNVLHEGLGIKRDIRRTNRQAKKTFQKAGRALAKELKPIAKELYRDVKKHATQKMKEQIADAIQTEYMPAVGERLDHYTGDTYYSDRLNQSTKQALANRGMLHDGYGGYTDYYDDGYSGYMGSGLRVVPRVGRSTLSTRGKLSATQQKINENMADAQEYEALGGVVQMTDVQKRMAKVRSYKTGGSLISDTKRGFRKIHKNEATRYLGGSMLPLR